MLPACSSTQSFSPADFTCCTWKLLSELQASRGRHRGPEMVRAPALQEGSQRRRPFPRPSANTKTHTGFYPSSAHALDGPMSSTHAGLSPPTLQPDIDIKDALCRLVGSPLSSDDWRLASLGISAGGARSAQQHAPAAYVAGLSATAALSDRIWHAFDEYKTGFWLLPLSSRVRTPVACPSALSSMNRGTRLQRTHGH